jgi:hypothetical protein
MGKVFTFKSKVWRWPGDVAWHFVNLDKDLSAKIKKIGVPYGAGMIKVEVAVGKSHWVSALFPQRRSESYILSIKKAIREKEDIWEGNEIKISIKLV